MYNIGYSSHNYDHILESPSIGTRLKSICNESKDIKNMFSNDFKRATDSLTEDETDLEFEEGCVPI